MASRGIALDGAILASSDGDLIDAGPGLEVYGDVFPENRNLHDQPLHQRFTSF